MLENRVHNINSKFSVTGWTPIQLISRPLDDSELAALYRDSNVALVTPLRDGMNLTGKEFVACRIQPDKPGVLILSPFVGAADLMQEALIVNPYEIGRVADYLHNALTMPVPEAEVRMNALRAREKNNDLKYWMKSFFREIDNLAPGEDSMSSRRMTMDSIKIRDFDSMLNKYMAEPGWSKLCLLLDYDGTLAPHGSHPDLTVLPEATKEVLQRLADMPEVFVSVITGRCIPDIKAKVNIKNITYAGNHGIDIIHPDGTKVRRIIKNKKVILLISPKFVPPMPEEVEEKASWLLQKLQAECCVDGAWVENKGIVLALHHEAWKDKGSIGREVPR
jgi:trehalose 6-phosphate synthase/phosphatase